jgi:integrase
VSTGEGESLAKNAGTKRLARKRGHGEGTIDQRPEGCWRGRLMVGYKPDGKPDRRVVYEKTRAECQRKLDELRQRAGSGLLGDAARERDSVAGHLERWLSTTRSNVRPKTHKRYGEIVRLHLVPGLGRHRLSALRPDHVQQLYEAKMASGLAPRTVHHCHAVLHRAIEQAVRWGYVPRNVCDAVAPPSVPYRELEPPKPDQLGQLMDAAHAAGDRLAALWTVAIYSGCRQGELLGLQWRDVDLGTGRLSVRRSLESARGGVPEYGEAKTDKSRRTLTLPPEASAALRAHRDRQNFERQRLSEGWSDYGLVFTTVIGTPLDQRNVIRFFKAALKRAGLPQTIRFHDLRHAAATLMLASGVDQKTAASRLGHSTIRLTMDLYTHAVQALDVDAAERMQRLLRGTVPS